MFSAITSKHKAEFEKPGERASQRDPDPQRGQGRTRPRRRPRRRPKPTMFMPSSRAGRSSTSWPRAPQPEPPAAEGGDLGEFKRGKLAKIFEDETFSMNAGQFTKPIRTKQGFVIFLVTAHDRGGVPPLKDVLPQVEEAIGTERTEPALRAYLKQLRQEAYLEYKPGYVDTAYVVNPSKPTYSAYNPPATKKKKKVQRTRYRQRAFGSGPKKQLASAPATAPAAAPAEAPVPNVPSLAEVPGGTNGAAGRDRESERGEPGQRRSQRAGCRHGRAGQRRQSGRAAGSEFEFTRGQPLDGQFLDDEAGSDSRASGAKARQEREDPFWPGANQDVALDGCDPDRGCGSEWNFGHRRQCPERRGRRDPGRGQRQRRRSWHRRRGCRSGKRSRDSAIAPRLPRTRSPRKPRSIPLRRLRSTPRKWPIGRRSRLRWGWPATPRRQGRSRSRRRRRDCRTSQRRRQRRDDTNVPPGAPPATPPATPGATSATTPSPAAPAAPPTQ